MTPRAGRVRRGVVAVVAGAAATLAVAPLAAALGLGPSQPAAVPQTPAVSRQAPSTTSTSTSPPTSHSPSQPTTSTSTPATTQPSTPPTTPSTDPGWTPPAPNVACVSLKVAKLGMCLPGAPDGSAATRARPSV